MRGIVVRILVFDAGFGETHQKNKLIPQIILGRRFMSWKSHGSFTKNRDEQTNFDYKQNLINLLLAR